MAALNDTSTSAHLVRPDRRDPALAWVTLARQALERAQRTPRRDLRQAVDRALLEVCAAEALARPRRAS